MFPYKDSKIVSVSLSIPEKKDITLASSISVLQ